MDDGGDMKATVKAAANKAGIDLADIWLDGFDYSNTTHYGNWCLVPVKHNLTTEKLAIALGTKTDLYRTILEPQDLDNFKTGDKVHLEFDSALGFHCSRDGRVHARSSSAISIIGKHKHKLGWIFMIGDSVTITHRST